METLSDLPSAGKRQIFIKPHQYFRKWNCLQLTPVLFIGLPGSTDSIILEYIHMEKV